MPPCTCLCPCPCPSLLPAPLSSPAPLSYPAPLPSPAPFSYPANLSSPAPPFQLSLCSLPRPSRCFPHPQAVPEAGTTKHPGPSRPLGSPSTRWPGGQGRRAWPAGSETPSLRWAAQPRGCTACVIAEVAGFRRTATYDRA
eukprot:365215-Chlamydomonas_euryale.AAC.1